MSSNPNNAVGTNGAFGGRTSVNAFNDVMGALSRGVLSGWACVPNSGLTVSLGGNGTTRDTAVAEDNAGNKTSINNISNSPINVTIGAAPGTNSRIDSIVAYVDNPPSVSAEVTDNPSVCGLIVVPGTAASTPSPANDSAIRTAITGDGASGTTAYYVVLAYVTMASGTTDITSNLISAGPYSQMLAKLPNNSITASQIDFATLSGNYSTAEQNTNYTWVDGKTVYKKTIATGALPNVNSPTRVAHGVANLDTVISLSGFAKNGTIQIPLPFPFVNSSTLSMFVTEDGYIQFDATENRTNFSGYVTMYYTKSA